VDDLTLTVRPLLVRVHFIRRKKLRSVFGPLDFLEVPDQAEERERRLRLPNKQLQKGMVPVKQSEYQGKDSSPLITLTSGLEWEMITTSTGSDFCLQLLN
jgi:hypothetical protein